MISESGLRLEERDGVWALTGPAASRFGLVGEYLGYLADRNYSPKTVRAYGYDLLAFCRWLVAEEQPLTAVTTEVLLRFLRACREATVPGRPGPNVRVYHFTGTEHEPAAYPVGVGHRTVSTSSASDSSSSDPITSTSGSASRSALSP